RHRMLDALPKIRRLEREHQLDAVVADTHELHPQALAQACAVVALFGDFGLVPTAGLRFSSQDLADAASESALLCLDEVTDDLVCAPLFGIKVPCAVIA